MFRNKHCSNKHLLAPRVPAHVIQLGQASKQASKQAKPSRRMTRATGISSPSSIFVMEILFPSGGNHEQTAAFVQDSKLAFNAY
ncbi:unnamed protein product [Onchocerca flexuosa]|uniref:Uncharacterized protein n=1 Tax=Onchocerca flexuosa TaxID=387005 RepID=A0A183I4B8_9BILA|nr:unnamed protein product [Onchocerca flexuosa]